MSQNTQMSNTLTSLPNRLLRASEVGEILSVDAKTVRRWAQSGELDCVRLNCRCIRFRPEDVVKLTTKGNE